ncbi:hypothetical protein DL765_002172 [Monosporascus sp. GIB2]|nr:hypothetical protein DL765_002172 [Monosporascus sp. GIB2]
MSSTTVSGAYPFAQLPFATSAIVLGFLSLLYLTYHWALPKPLPGIPCNKGALKTVLGNGAESNKSNRPEQGVDRASCARDALRGIIPWHHIGMRTADPQFWRNRELVKYLMMPHFLNTVNAPAIYDNTQTFLDLWRAKARLAGDRPFQADQGIHMMTFDIIKVAMLGEGDNQSMTARCLNTVLSATSTDQISKTTKGIVYVFPKNEASDDLRGHQTQQEVVGESTTHPSPKLFHMFHNLTGPMREAFALKSSMLDKQVSLAHLAVNQNAQKKLRDSLSAAYAEAFDAGRQPSVAEITKSSVPYLDAVMEEILRLSAPIRQLVREAMVGATFLGHRVPKGAQVFLSISGPGFTSLSLPVDEAVRSKSSKLHRGTTTGSWDHAEPQAFVLERWLNKTVEDGGVAKAQAYRYDVQAGPLPSAWVSGVASAKGWPLSSTAPCPGR